MVVFVLYRFCSVMVSAYEQPTVHVGLMLLVLYTVTQCAAAAG